MKNKIVIQAIIVAFVAIVVSWFIVKKGVKVPTGDSMSYLNCSKVIYEHNEHSFIYSTLKPDGSVNIMEFEKNTVWPPATSFILALLQKTGIGLYYSAIIFVLFFTFTTVFFLVIFSNMITNSEVASIVIALLFSFSWNFFYWVGVSVMAEGLFLTITLISALLLIRHLSSVKDSKKINLFLIGITFGFSYLIKSAAPAFIFSGTLLVFLNYKTLKEKILYSFIFGIGVLVPAFPWLLRNLQLNTIGSSGSGPTKHAILESTLNLLRLFVPRHGGYFESNSTILFAFLFIVSLLFILTLPIVRKRLIKPALTSTLNNIRNDNKFKFVLIYLVFFIIVMLFSMYVIPLAINIETRYWMEIFPFIVPFFYSISMTFYKIYDLKYKHLVNRIFIFLAILICFSNIFEICRNIEKDWITLNDDAERAKIRRELSIIINSDKNVRFTSNKPVDFEVKTGLTNWPDLDYNDSNLNCFVELPYSSNEMSLSNNKTEIPADYYHKITYKNIKFYFKTDKF